MPSNFGDIEGTEVEERVYGYDQNCQANGCFMAAGNATEWWGTEAGVRNGAPKAGVCGYHASTKSFQWQKVTNNLHKAKTLITLWHRFQQLPAHVAMDMKPQEVPGYPSTAPLEDEGIYEWMNRIRDLVDYAAKYNLPEEPEKKVNRAGATMNTLIAEATSKANVYHGGDV